MNIQDYAILLESIKTEHQRELIVTILRRYEQPIYKFSCIVTSVSNCRDYSYLKYTGNELWEGSGHPEEQIPISAKEFITKFGKFKPKNNLF